MTLGVSCARTGCVRIGKRRRKQPCTIGTWHTLIDRPPRPKWTTAPGGRIHPCGGVTRGAFRAEYARPGVALDRLDKGPGHRDQNRVQVLAPVILLHPQVRVAERAGHVDQHEVERNLPFVKDALVPAGYLCQRVAAIEQPAYDFVVSSRVALGDDVAGLGQGAQLRREVCCVLVEQIGHALKDRCVTEEGHRWLAWFVLPAACRRTRRWFPALS